jgi:hypothetical protein
VLISSSRSVINYGSRNVDFFKRSILCAEKIFACYSNKLVLINAFQTSLNSNLCMTPASETQWAYPFDPMYRRYLRLGCGEDLRAL